MTRAKYRGAKYRTAAKTRIRLLEGSRPLEREGVFRAQTESGELLKFSYGAHAEGGGFAVEVHLLDKEGNVAKWDIDYFAAGEALTEEELLEKYSNYEVMG